MHSRFETTALGTLASGIGGCNTGPHVLKCFLGDIGLVSSTMVRLMARPMPILLPSRFRPQRRPGENNRPRIPAKAILGYHTPREDHQSFINSTKYLYNGTPVENSVLPRSPPLGIQLISRRLVGGLLAGPPEGLPRDDEGPPLGLQVRLVDDGRGVRPDDATNGHEEARNGISISFGYATAGGGPRCTNPKVAPDMAMYCPRVLMMPLGPAPYLKMVVVPGCASVWRLACRGSGGCCTEDEADDHADS